MHQLTDWVLQDDEIDFSSLNEWRLCCLTKIRRLACPSLHCPLQLSDVVVTNEFKQIILELVDQHTPQANPVVRKDVVFRQLQCVSRVSLLRFQTVQYLCSMTDGASLVR